MENIFITILNRSITAGWLILAVLLLRMILIKMPKGVLCVLWGFVGFRLICPFFPRAIFSLIPSVQTIHPDIVYQQEPAIYSGIPVLNQLVNPVLADSFSPEISASANPLQIWTCILSFIWTAGMLLLAIYAAISYWRLYRNVQESVKWKDNIYFCDHIGTPFILGTVRPKIYLPSSIKAEQIVYVEFHEKAHLARYDHLWKLLGFTLLTVYWFQPLCWAAYWIFCRDLEFACDEKVVRNFDLHNRKEYAKALLECTPNYSRIGAYPLAFGEINVKERIKNVLNDKRPVFWKSAIGSVVCIIVALCFLTNPREQVFGYHYVVEDVAYYALIYSDLSVPQASSEYYLTEDYELIKKEKASGEYDVQGSVSEMTLTSDNFDKYIVENLAGLDEIIETTSLLREENEKTWVVENAEGTKGAFYYILQQKNGELYLCYGYNSGTGEDAFIIGWIFKLQKKDKIGTSLTSDG